PALAARWYPALALAALALVAASHAYLRYQGPVLFLDRVDPRLASLSYWHPLMGWIVPAVLAFFAALAAAGVPGGWPWARRAGRGMLVAATVLAGLWLWRTPGVLPASAATAALAGAVLLGVPALHRDEQARFAASRTGKAVRAWRQVLDATVGRAPVALLSGLAITAGVATRLASPFIMDLWADGNTYSAMGHMWAETGRLLVPYGEASTVPPMEPQPSHHYPPLFPILLGLGYKAFGFGLWQTKAMAVTFALGAIAAAWWTTRDLYGQQAGLFVAGAVALQPHLLWSTGTNFSENVVVILFAFTIWAILKSLDQPRFIILAGLFAGLAYLTRSSIGAFFLVAGVGGFLWRFLYLRWRVLADRHYLLAILIFGSLVALWAGRNIRVFGGWPDWDLPWESTPWQWLGTTSASAGGIFALFASVLFVAGLLWLGRPAARAGVPRPDGPLRGLRYATLAGAVLALAALAVAWLSHNIVLHGQPPWQTSAYTETAMEQAFGDPRLFLEALAYKAPFFLLFLLPYAFLLWPEIRRSGREVRTESVSALWLAVVLVWIIGWLMSSVFWVREQSTIFWLDNHRYVVMALPAVLWLVARDADWRSPRLRWRVAGTYLVLACLTLVVVLAPVRHMEQRAMESLHGRLEPGMGIGFEGAVNKYATYAYQDEHDLEVEVLWRDADGTLHGGRPHFIIEKTRNADWARHTYDGYVMEGEWVQKYWNGDELVAVLWRRADVPDTRVREMPFTSFEQGPGGLQGLQIAMDADHLRVIWRMHRPAETPPQVDFANHTLLAVAFGDQPGLRQVEVTRVVYSSDLYTVDVRQVVQECGGALPLVAHLVLVPRPEVGYPFVAVGQVEEVHVPCDPPTAP
ncbi:MAG TPA: glycosyltransferase family 39 protein, partial [Candidatus Thermoplasmatota archaeon]|nr:glycosyltransferase family 39 protein [Candidatus Thermoplasmatota archaeon]